MAAIVTGYYRYTDIMFEWWQVLADPAAQSALKGLISVPSLTHPDHPLRNKDQPGLELWMGTVSTGESRLMFSSAQIEYIRYYLHAVGLVPYLIPIPSSHYLLTSTSLHSVSPVYYAGAAELKVALKVIGKNNKKLKGTDPRLQSLRSLFERTRANWAEKRGTWISIDFEGWEMKHTDITEFGYSMVRWKDGQLGPLEEGHWTVREMVSIRNHKYLPDKREFFHYGTSVEKPLKQFTKDIQAFIEPLASPENGPLFLIFHDASGDIKYLKQLGVPSASVATRNIPEVPPSSGVFILDTAELFAGLEGWGDERRNLERMCRLLGYREGLVDMHNAGNDAHWTLEALLTMASGDPLDIQREKRWPSEKIPNIPGVPQILPASAGSRVQVKREAWELDSDYDDMEGMFGAVEK